MWIMAMFDLPVDTPAARRRYTGFRKNLLEEGFLMFQFSVYGRHCVSEEKADTLEKRIISHLPAEGEVRILKFTDLQFSRMKIFHGKTRKTTEAAPQQITLF